MRDRSFADFVVGALACVSVLGFYAFVRENESLLEERRRLSERRWELPRRRRAHGSAEDHCRHCRGAGHCENCAPSSCRVCQGTGTQPRDAALLSRLQMLWDGAA